MNWIPKYKAGTMIIKRNFKPDDIAVLFTIVGYNTKHEVYIIDEIDSLLGIESVLRIHGPTFDMNEHEYELFFEK
jgi:hypothetical protein